MDDITLTSGESLSRTYVTRGVFVKWQYGKSDMESCFLVSECLGETDVTGKIVIKRSRILHLLEGKMAEAALCGNEEVVPTMIPLRCWGNKDYWWCDTCRMMAQSQGARLGEPLSPFLACMICGNEKRRRDHRGVCIECRRERKPPKKT